MKINVMAKKTKKSSKNTGKVKSQAKHKTKSKKQTSKDVRTDTPNQGGNKKPDTKIPGDSLEAQIKHLQAAHGEIVEALEAKNESLKKELQEYKKELNQLKKELESWEEKGVTEEMRLQIEQDILKRLEAEMKAVEKDQPADLEEAQEKPKPKNVFTPSPQIIRNGVYYQFQNNKNNRTGGYTKNMAEAMQKLHEARRLDCVIEPIPDEFLEPELLEDEEKREKAEIYLIYTGSKQTVPQLVKTKYYGEEETDNQEETEG